MKNTKRSNRLNNMVIIKTKDFVLRPVKLSDAKGILECYQDKETAKCYRNCLSTMRDARKSCEKWIRESRKKKPLGEKWVIEHEKNKTQKPQNAQIYCAHQ